mmetsp:Transcript_7064/g.14477  ORF Transcript_7064/g.14477 Transcript_7064/m.14477 type:complete len:88 (-) Transcript_7064:3-266(-)
MTGLLVLHARLPGPCSLFKVVLLFFSKVLSMKDLGSRPTAFFFVVVLPRAKRRIEFSWWDGLHAYPAGGDLVTKGIASTDQASKKKN